MRVEGSIQRSGKWWAIEVPLLGIYTQGRTRHEAFEMVRDAARMLADEVKRKDRSGSEPLRPTISERPKNSLIRRSIPLSHRLDTL